MIFTSSEKLNAGFEFLPRMLTSVEGPKDDKHVLENPQRNSENISIPHKIIILDSRYPTLEGLPKIFQDNIKNTVNLYRGLWGEPDAPLLYLGNKECREAIRVAEPQLLPYYDREQRGQNFADVCRVAILHQQGGYYFDTDMRSVVPVPVPNDVSFVTAYESGRKALCNSVLFTTPGHPIMRKALDVMLEFYQRKHQVRSINMGTATLRDAFNETPEQQRGKTFLLNEVNLGSKPVYKDFPRQNGTGCCCNFVVDGPGDQIYFYSRIVGAGKFCGLPTDQKALMH